MNPNIIWRGRLILQGMILTDYTMDMVEEFQEYQESDKDPSDAAELIASSAWHTGMMGLQTMLVWLPLAKPYAVGWTATKLAPTVQVVAAGAAAVTTGYAIGAVTGTVIANEIWGEEGAQVAMGFYSGGLLPGTEAPDLSDYQYILKPTAPGGPDSLYDIGKQTFDGLKSTGKALWLKSRPRRRRRFNPFNR